MSRTGDNVKIPLDTETALSMLLRVKPTADMPRPGKGRSKSVFAEMNEEFGPIAPHKPGKARTGKKTF